MSESFDEASNLFITSYYTIELEHSLVSLSKWESFFEKPFLSPIEKTTEETLWYIRTMTKTPDVPPEIFLCLSEKNFAEISDYINGKSTATTFREMPHSPSSREIITAEIIRYWMIALNIPAEYESWHLNQLFALIRVTNLKNAPPKKVGKQEAAQRQQSLNARRLAELGTRG
jgi:hypothetical protein